MPFGGGRDGMKRAVGWGCCLTDLGGRKYTLKRIQNMSASMLCPFESDKPSRNLISEILIQFKVLFPMAPPALQKRPVHTQFTL